MPGNDISTDAAPTTKEKSSSQPDAEKKIDSALAEQSQSQGNDPAAVIEAAQQAEKAVSEAINGMAQLLESMRNEKI